MPGRAQILGNRFVKVIEKITGDDRYQTMDLCFDVPAVQLVGYVIREMEAGGVGPEGLDSEPPPPYPQAAWGLLPSDGSVVIHRTYPHSGSPEDQGLTLHQMGVQPGDTIYLSAR